MNLNITPTDKISEELAAIDAFLNITMSEEVQEAVLRGNDLAVYIARTGKLLADAKYHLNGKKKSESIRHITGNRFTGRSDLKGHKRYHRQPVQG
mgnify:CR=1 FL=1